MLSIDLNSDMGEGMENDAAIIPFISSVNIACGYHAGDETIMRRTIELALAHQVAIGAHPSYPDREHFGRIDMLDPASSLVPSIGIADLPEILTDQLATLVNICHACGARLHHVKLHGALYNRAARDRAVSAIFCETLRGFDPSLIIYGLSGSSMQEEADRCGLRFVHEVFADRGYEEDGSLTPRGKPHAMIDDPVLAATRALTLIRDGRVMVTSGAIIRLPAETICIHGDGAHAVLKLPGRSVKRCRLRESLLRHPVQGPPGKVLCKNTINRTCFYAFLKRSDAG